ncbi:MAG: GNAT family N-acetyltransferase [Planctomycetales bacterium]|nr:GNAT family N-acetyltransferase [Planctomycetales bacterium]
MIPPLAGLDGAALREIEALPRRGAPAPWEDHPLSRGGARARAWFRGHLGSRTGQFFVVRDPAGTAAGLVGIESVAWVPRVAELALLRLPAGRRGIAAVRALVQVGFADWNLARLHAVVPEDRPAEIRALLAAGFRIEARMRGHFRGPRGRRDALWLGVVAGARGEAAGLPRRGPGTRSAGRGPELRLAPLRRADLAHTHRWRNDPETRDPLVAKPFFLTPEESRRWLTGLARRGTERAYFARLADGRPVGYGRVKEISRRHGTGLLEWAIGEPGLRGRGLGRSLGAAVLDRAFGEIGLRRVYGLVADWNAANLGCVRSLGFEVEGRLRRHFVVAGRPCDAIVVGLAR